jgi:hypothetical protein
VLLAGIIMYGTGTLFCHLDGIYDASNRGSCVVRDANNAYEQ